MNVLNLNTEVVTVPEMIRDNIGLIVSGNVESVDSDSLELLDCALQQRSITNRKHRLRRIFRKWPQTGSISSRHNDSAERKGVFLDQVAQEPHIHNPAICSKDWNLTNSTLIHHV